MKLFYVLAKRIQLDGSIYIPSGVTITTDQANPATLVMDRKVVSGLCVQGESIKIENVTIDFGMGGVWLPFRAAISFKFPSFKHKTPDAPIQNVTIDNVTFVNSSPPVERKDSRDSWAISFANNSEEPLKNIVVKNCRQLAKQVQLTANGNGHGILNLQITDNYCEHGHANAIAVSSAVDGGFFKNILIARNELRQCTSIGIFVGVDGGKGLPSLQLQNIIITENHIEMSSNSSKFATAILIRPLGSCTGVNIRRNFIDTRQKTTDSSPHWFSLQGRPKFEATYRFEDNILLGRGINIIRHATELTE